MDQAYKSTLAQELEAALPLMDPSFDHFIYKATKALRAGEGCDDSVVDMTFIAILTEDERAKALLLLAAEALSSGSAPPPSEK